MADKCFVKSRICTEKKKLDKLHLFFIIFYLRHYNDVPFLPDLLEVPLGFIYIYILHDTYSKIIRFVSQMMDVDITM